MRRIAALVAILAVTLPAVVGWAASFNVSYSGSTVIVVPIEDVVTERQGAPAATTTPAPSVMILIDDREKAGATATPEATLSVATATPSVQATPTPRPLPKAPQVVGFNAGGVPWP